jgi:two-component system KDP operon response regulator KdpE
MFRPLILIVEDELPMLRVLRVALKTQGYDVQEAVSAREGLERLVARRPNLILLDLGLPDLDGTELTSQIREQCEVPIIVISARSEERHQIQALDAGANDYVTKPFREGELLARVRASLRHAARGPSASDVYRIGALSIDALQHRVLLGESEVNLTPTEFKLLSILVREAGRVVTHQQLLREVWGPAQVEEVQYLRVYMKQLRQKLETDPAQPTLLITTPGVGYGLKAPD